ncbi:IS110 family transposase [Klenkia sp. PcliD-1-E]|uniref:IS110 family transposase n=1 Tax=Klenkia sp. PcliD-1-E TaxID=2954492 RepID=UPI0020975CFA|nr:IS110 family transposase [Klenkia sp. PcliD-1-E]MCO7218364.1 IS110 family transposase [Klenkia sp. PcliD-1-E]
MTSMTSTRRVVTVGVDPHSDTHHAAVFDEVGRPIADAGFPTTPEGYRHLREWAAEHGEVAAFGVEGTGAYGAGLARDLRAAGQVVIEVDRPDRKTRRQHGKSDPIDAYAAAAAVLSGAAVGIPKTRDGQVEAIRTLRVARRSAIKGRTQAINQLKAVVLTGPAQLRLALAGQSTRELLGTCRRMRTTQPPSQASDPVAAATRSTLRRLARRITALTEEIADIDTELQPLVQATAPQLMDVYGVGTEVGAQLLITAGDDPDRLRSEAAFAQLCGTAPLPASNGRTTRHRLNRGGDRHANYALHVIALVRLSAHQPTRDYAARRRAQGLSNLKIIRCLKRYIAREIHHVLTT